MKWTIILARLAVAGTWSDPAAPIVPTAQERAALESGQTVYRKDLGHEGSSGISMVLVDAPPERIWRVILDFDSYVAFLPYVTASWSEPRQAGQPRELYRWGMELTTKGVVTRYSVATLWSGGEVATFEMTPVGYSPMSKAKGWWRVQSWGELRCLLVYSVDVETMWWVPGSVHKMAADRGLPAMVTLVGDRSEKIK